LISISIYPFIKNTFKHNILGINDITITATVKTDQIRFKIYPEKRFPQINNWSNQYEIIMQNCNSNQFLNFSNVFSNNYGEGAINTSSSLITNASYRFIFQGTSHLRHKTDCYQINKVEQSIDFTLESKELRAGEISAFYDNYINSLDISKLEKDYLSSNIKSDLNRDGKVNSLDLSILINNLFIAGE
jgi:hypothetical protein